LLPEDYTVLHHVPVYKRPKRQGPLLDGEIDFLVIHPTKGVLSIEVKGGGIERDAETGKERCVGCGLCAAMCPSQCIHIYTSEGEEHQKIVDRYEVEVLRCVYCALCVEACPYAALVLTDHFEYSGYTRGEFYYTKEMLLANWDKYMSGDKGMNYIKNFWRPRSGDFVKKVESKPAEKVEK